MFVVECGRLRRRDVEIWHRGTLEVEIANGVSAGEQIVGHPCNDVEDGRRVRDSSADGVTPADGILRSKALARLISIKALERSAAHAGFGKGLLGGGSGLAG